MKKRKWIYVQKPVKYEIACDKCDGVNIEWSEYEGMIWCYDCEIDTRGTKGVFGGPIPINAAAMFGMSFDRINLETKKLEKCQREGNKIVWKEKESD